MVCGCPARPRPSFALDLTKAGQIRWQVPLGLPGSRLQASPLAFGAVAVFAQSDVYVPGRAGALIGSQLEGLSLADGHRLWTRTFRQSIAGMWRWQHLVVVLLQATESGQPLVPVLTGLDPSTGQARWTLRNVGFSPTADGGLARFVQRHGAFELEVVDPASGRVRWTRPVGPNELPMVVDDGVLVAANNQLTSYDDRTGRVRWTEPLRGPRGWLGLDTMQAVGRLVYLTGEVQRGSQTTHTLLVINPADGRVQRRFAYNLNGSVDPYAPGLMSVRAVRSGAHFGTWQEVLDPATGRVRWQVASPYQAVAARVGIVTARGRHRISMRDTRTGRIRWTARLNGGWLPLDAGPWQTYPKLLPVLPAGRLLVVQTAGQAGSTLLVGFRMSDGHREWQVAIPGPAVDPLSATRGGLLVYAA